VQDFRGRMKPLDTLARETAVKITKKTTFEGRDPVEVFLGFVVHPSAWYHYPSIAVKHPGVQDLIGVNHATHHVSLASLLQGGQYKLQAAADEAHRTPANQRDKTQQKLILFDERVHIQFGALQGTSMRIFPIPDDPGHTWESIDKVLEVLPEGDPRRAEFQTAADALFGGLTANDDAMIREGLRLTAALQEAYGAEVMPSTFRVDAERTLNSLHPFARSTLPYLLAFLLLIIAYFVGLFRNDGKPWSWKHPLYSIGMLAFVAGFALHTYGFVLRWIASGRAPLSNGHESLLWVALAVALAGLIFEVLSKTAAAGALGALLTAVVLGVSMMAAFDPAIGPLVPVLASYWLNIHVTIITASYGFLGLACFLGLLTLVLYVVNWRGAGRPAVDAAVAKLDRLNVDVMIAGLGLLSVGTLLGGVWANESWGRYWGWDPKETWALVSILIYATILHFRWIPKLNNPYVQATGSFLAIWSIVMTYFGVNYLLVGLHSYAAGDAVTIPTWVILSFAGSVVLSLIAYFAWSDNGRTRRVAPSGSPS
jgi:cytochrome c-type biogenesis protein CcsB